MLPWTCTEDSFSFAAWSRRGRGATARTHPRRRRRGASALWPFPHLSMEAPPARCPLSETLLPQLRESLSERQRASSSPSPARSRPRSRLTRTQYSGLRLPQHVQRRSRKSRDMARHRQGSSSERSGQRASLDAGAVTPSCGGTGCGQSFDDEAIAPSCRRRSAPHEMTDLQRLKPPA